MNRNPTRKVLSSMQKHGVRCLLMGGQACVFYGAAEFSRDVDFAVLAEARNLDHLRTALEDLRAKVIAVPPFEEKFLQKGLAVHFRCHAPEVKGLRVDVMSNLRGVDEFGQLWQRRTTLEEDGERIELMSLPDLVQAKKTQREKDWPMIRRLVEAHWFENRHQPTPQRLDFWLGECRTPEILIELAASQPATHPAVEQRGAILAAARSGNRPLLEEELENERRLEMLADKAYWLPLKKELEQLRLLSRNPQ